MSTFTLVYTRAAAVTPSDAVDIPFPNIVLEGVNTSAATNKLIDDTVDFEAIGIKVGDTVMGIVGASAYYTTVIGVDAGFLLLNDDLFTTPGLDYFIYQGVNNGCYIYVPAQEAGAILGVETIGGDQVTFTDPPAGILHVQVSKVLESTTATNLIALW
jgi:hypothetical protein